MKQAMIFAAGLGTRLKPLTDTMPKALVPVAGQPLLRQVIGRLQQAGFTRLVVNVHHFSQQIIDYLQANGNFGLDISISDETDALLDTGGGLRKALAAGMFDPAAPVLIHNVDILSNVDLDKFYEMAAQAAPARSSALLLVSWRKTKRYLLFDDQMMLVGWVNLETGEVRSPYPEVKATVGALRFPLAPADEPMVLAGRYHAYAFSGIHCVAPGLLGRMAGWPDKFPIIDFYLSECRNVAIRGYAKADLRLMDVGKLDTLSAADDFVRTLRNGGTTATGTTVAPAGHTTTTTDNNINNI
jgi:GTP:adenosylcobinamide-phosphate guanylyltransferase